MTLAGQFKSSLMRENMQFPSGIIGMRLFMEQLRQKTFRDNQWNYTLYADLQALEKKEEKAKSVPLTNLELEKSLDKAEFTQVIHTEPHVSQVGRRFTEINWSAAVLKNSVSRLPTGTLHVRRSCTSLKKANGERRSEAEPRYFSFELTLMKATMKQQKDSSNLSSSNIIST